MNYLFFCSLIIFKLSWKADGHLAVWVHWIKNPKTGGYGDMGA